MMQIPLQAVPNQTLSVTLDRQPVQIALRQNGANLYMDLLNNGEYVVRTRICRDRQRLLLDAAYQGFAGDFVFVDTQGADNPTFRGLGGVGSRYQLIYLSAGE
jgi:hypothetical protein